MRPTFFPGKEGKTVFSQLEVNPIGAIKNPKKHKASSQDFVAFSGPPKKCDQTHVKLREMGWGMAQRVFHPPNV